MEYHLSSYSFDSFESSMSFSTSSTETSCTEARQVHDNGTLCCSSTMLMRGPHIIRVQDSSVLLELSARVFCMSVSSLYCAAASHLL